jgi:hypothetical protein
MQLQQAIRDIFLQLSNSLEQLTPEQYTAPSHILFTATIGQHVRHIAELFLCLNKGYETGIVNYEDRKRDHRIENDKAFAIELLQCIYMELVKEDRPLRLKAGYDAHSDEILTIETNYYREVVYNLEHTVHHMALIRVGINDVSSIVLPDGFGVASSTIKYRETCAQ